MLTRRDTIASGLAAAAAGCAPRPCPPLALPIAQSAAALIDGHCHMFNVKDLSAVRFISIVLAERYPAAAFAPRSDPEDPDALDRLVELLLALVGATAAPSAVREQALLERRAVPRAPGEDKAPIAYADQERATIARVADLLQGRWFGDADAEARLRGLILDGEARRAAAPVALSQTEALAIAARAVRGESAPGRSLARDGLDLKGIFKFVGELRRFRHCLVDDLTMFHREQRQQPLLFAPAMVDFGRWLRDDPETGSTFADQIAVWRSIARRRGGPAVHGYVGFCPLRQILFDRGRLRPGVIDTACNHDPLAIVRRALTECGFIGVKLYPPMGFRAANNASVGGDTSYPLKILVDVFGPGGDAPAVRMRNSVMLGGMIDGALERLWALCDDLKAPVMAHAANSNAAAAGTGALADPYFWRPVFEGARPPAIMLAHFGGFADRSADPEGLTFDPKAPKAFTASWEASLARYVRRHPDRPVFADLSMFTELLGTVDEAHILACFKYLGTEYSEMTSHLVFGTDWVMLAKDSRASRYDGRVREFLAAAFGAAAVEPIMRHNFLRFAGLAQGSPAFERIATVYEGDAMLRHRLSAACAD